MISVPPKIKARYMFSVQTEIASYRLGESPEGSRIDIEYKAGGCVRTNPDLFFRSWDRELGEAEVNNPGFLPLKEEERADWLREARRAENWPSGIDWLGLEGELISGSDWILVRRDGVAEMSGHATLREEKWVSREKDRGGNIINVDLMTVADLGEAAVPSFAAMPNPPALDPKDVYEAWKASHTESELHFVLSLRFAVADGTQPWAGTTYGSLEGFWRLKKLPRCQYAGNAKAKLVDGLLRLIELDIWRIGFEELPLAWDKSHPIHI